MIPWKLYTEFLPIKGKVSGNNIGGINVNLDKMNLATVSRQGILLDTYTVRIPQLKVQGLLYDGRTSIMIDAVHKVLNYAVIHGCSVIVLENPRVLGLPK